MLVGIRVIALKRRGLLCEVLGADDVYVILSRWAPTDDHGRANGYRISRQEIK